MTAPATLALAFAEGIALILSPCVLPVLPLMLGAALDGSRARPLGIVTGFVLAFTVFALVSRQAVLALGLDAEIIRYLALVMLAVFGLVLLLPRLSEIWTEKLRALGGGGNALIDRINAQGYWGGVGIGALIGLVWTPCAGPILAAAILQTVQADSGTGALATIAAFALGAAIPMVALALSGRALADRLGFFKKHGEAIRRGVGVLMIAAALAIFTGLDLKLVAWQAQYQAKDDVPVPAAFLKHPYPAPEIRGVTGWINSQPLTLEQLRGKVVLIDFWTYSCINCIRTMPYITRWYDQYKDAGLVVIGVHAPEFAFEKKRGNVEKAVRQYGIRYPVALDNDFATWRAYENRYWPAHYLIDREGRIVYTHFGEGQYAQTENNIRSLLGITGIATVKPVAIRTDGQSPETYLGYQRAENFKSPETIERDTAAEYTFPAALEPNEWALNGQWTLEAQHAVSGDSAAMRFHYKAGKVYLVLGTADGAPLDAMVTVDGRKITGGDVKDGVLTVYGERLYTLVDGRIMGPGKGVIEIRPRRAGLQAYAFTFGK